MPLLSNQSGNRFFDTAQKNPIDLLMVRAIKLCTLFIVRLPKQECNKKAAFFKHFLQISIGENGGGNLCSTGREKKSVKSDTAILGVLTFSHKRKGGNVFFPFSLDLL